MTTTTEQQARDIKIGPSSLPAGWGLAPNCETPQPAPYSAMIWFGAPDAAWPPSWMPRRQKVRAPAGRRGRRARRAAFAHAARVERLRYATLKAGLHPYPVNTDPRDWRDAGGLWWGAADPISSPRTSSATPRAPSTSSSSACR